MESVSCFFSWINGVYTVLLCTTRTGVAWLTLSICAAGCHTEVVATGSLHAGLVGATIALRVWLPSPFSDICLKKRWLGPQKCLFPTHEVRQRSRQLAEMYVSMSGQVKWAHRRWLCCRVTRPKSLVRDGHLLYFLLPLAPPSVSAGVYRRKATAGTHACKKQSTRVPAHGHPAPAFPHSTAGSRWAGWTCPPSPGGWDGVVVQPGAMPHRLPPVRAAAWRVC